MATKVIMPALGIAQDTGILAAWLKQEGDAVSAGEPLMEIETDKTTAEVEAPAAGILAGVAAQPGDEVPVATVIAWILAPGESLPVEDGPATRKAAAPEAGAGPAETPVAASPLAARIAAEHGVDLRRVKRTGERVTKADVLAHVQSGRTVPAGDSGPQAVALLHQRLLPASPRARRLAEERGLELAAMAGSGPEGAVLAADVLAVAATAVAATVVGETVGTAATVAQSRAWRVMAGRLAQAWATIPHFYLKREIDASQLTAWRAAAQKRMAAQESAAVKVTYSDLLVKAVAVALRDHPRLNAAWLDGEIAMNPDINIGLAVAIDDGLLVPVIHHADQQSVAEIAAARQAVVGRAQEGRLKLADLQGGTFTISNLGMAGVDEFQAIVNPPQAAVLAVGRIAEKVVPVSGRPEIRPMMTLSLSCDHRVVDGARAAQFLEALVQLLEEPLGIL